jgi:hypothetical protein
LAPTIGELLFYNVGYSRLVAIADGRSWSKKTYNNGISVLRRAFDFGYRDRPLEENPARSLRGARLRKADRPKVDPFCMHDAETLIAAIHRDWGEAQGNYDEFRFSPDFGRPSRSRSSSRIWMSRTASSVSTRHASPALVDARQKPGKTGAWNCAQGRYRY